MEGLRRDGTSTQAHRIHYLLSAPPRLETVGLSEEEVVVVEDEGGGGVCPGGGVGVYRCSWLC